LKLQKFDKLVLKILKQSLIKIKRNQSEFSMPQKIKNFTRTNSYTTFETLLWKEKCMFLKYIVTTDETWIYYFEDITKKWHYFAKSNVYIYN